MAYCLWGLLKCRTRTWPDRHWSCLIDCLLEGLSIWLRHPSFPLNHVKSKFLFGLFHRLCMSCCYVVIRPICFLQNSCLCQQAVTRAREECINPKTSLVACAAGTHTTGHAAESTDCYILGESLQQLLDLHFDCCSLSYRFPLDMHLPVCLLEARTVV